MLSFKEYASRRDETSWNPFNQKSAADTMGGETGQMVKTVTGFPLGVGAAGVGAAAGFGSVPGAYRQHTTGNPYISPEEANRPPGMERPKTQRLATQGFMNASKWLLDFIAGQRPRDKKLYMATLYNNSARPGVLNQVSEYVKKGQRTPTAMGGVTAGAQGTTLGNIFALPLSLVKGAKQAIVNAWDSFNPEYDISREWPVQVQNMIYALDAMLTLPNGGGPEGLADSYVQELIFNLGQPDKVRQLGRQ